MNKKLLLSSVVASLVLIGCGGGGDNDEKEIASNASNAMKKAYYIDSGVERLDYKCGDIAGITGKGGEFTFSKATWCDFSIGGKKLDTESVSENGQKVFIADANISSILLSLDNDNNASNGIQISDKVKQAVKNSSSIDLSDLKAKDLIKKIYTEDEARAHLINTTKNSFQSLKGKTVYFIDTDTDSGSPQYDIEELRFNSDLTAISFDDEGSEKTYSLEFKEGGVVDLKNDNNETEVVFTLLKSTSKRVVLRKYDFHKRVEELVTLYFNQADAKKVLNNNSSQGNFTPTPITLDMLQGYKITYGSAWIEFDNSGGANLKDGRESGGGPVEIRGGNTVVVWPGQSYEYRLQFGSLPKVGTTVKVVKEGGKDSYFSTISSMQKTK